MAGPVVEDLTQLERGVTTYDAYLHISPVLAILADNPRHSELLNHSVGSADKYCRMCMVSIYILDEFIVRVQFFIFVFAIKG